MEKIKIESERLTHSRQSEREKIERRNKLFMDFLYNRLDIIVTLIPISSTNSQRKVLKEYIARKIETESERRREREKETPNNSLIKRASLLSNNNYTIRIRSHKPEENAARTAKRRRYEKKYFNVQISTVLLVDFVLIASRSTLILQTFVFISSNLIFLLPPQILVTLCK